MGESERARTNHRIPPVLFSLSSTRQVANNERTENNLQGTRRRQRRTRKKGIIRRMGEEKNGKKENAKKEKHEKT